MAVSLPVDMDASWPAQSGRTAGAEAIEADVMINQARRPRLRVHRAKPAQP